MGNPLKEYPYVDGPLSIKQYYEALDKCYQGWRVKNKNLAGCSVSHQVGVLPYTALPEFPRCGRVFVKKIS